MPTMSHVMREVGFCAALAIFVSSCDPSNRESGVDVSSPDGRTVVTFEMRNRAPGYHITRDGAVVIVRSSLGVELADGGSFAGGLRVDGQETRTVDTTWTQPWGEVMDVRDHHNELRIELVRTEAPLRRMDVVIRVFDDGVGFRYVWPNQPALGEFEITNELTEFAIADRYDAWWIPAYRRDRYEYLYTRSNAADLDSVHTPLTLQPLVDRAPYLSIHESDLTDFAAMTLIGEGSTSDASAVLRADLVPWSDGVKVRASAPHRSPWRTHLVESGSP